MIQKEAIKHSSTGQKKVNLLNFHQHSKSPIWVQKYWILTLPKQYLKSKGPKDRNKSAIIM